jgi:hypothetical protein
MKWLSIFRILGMSLSLQLKIRESMPWNAKGSGGPAAF